MAPTGENPANAGYDERMDFVIDLMEATLKFKVLAVEPLGYDPDSTRHCNNFVYKVHVAPRSAATRLPITQQPGTVYIPADLGTLILRLSNPTLGYSERIRVENEVAAMVLARDAARTFHCPLVAKVFAWQSGKDGQQGWLLQECLPGIPVARIWYDKDNGLRRNLLGQAVKIFECFYNYQLPRSIATFGRFAFDLDGKVVNAQLDELESVFTKYLDVGLPPGSYEDQQIELLRSIVSDQKGTDQYCERLQAFLETSFLHSLTSLSEPLRFVHGDFSMENVLYDPDSLLVTGIIDFDRAHIGNRGDALSILALASMLQ